eukprot:11780-Pelagococcus_subviridis.AAC.3
MERRLPSPRTEGCRRARRAEGRERLLPRQHRAQEARRMSSPGALLARRARLPSPSRDAPPPTAAVARDATTENAEKKT